MFWVRITHRAHSIDHSMERISDNPAGNNNYETSCDFIFIHEVWPNIFDFFAQIGLELRVFIFSKAKI